MEKTTNDGVDYIFNSYLDKLDPIVKRFRESLKEMTNKTKLISFIEKRNSITLRYDTINIKATNSKDFIKINVTTFDNECYLRVSKQKGVVEYGSK